MSSSNLANDDPVQANNSGGAGSAVSWREVGFVLPKFSWRITQEVIDKYAEVSGDFNPIHVDPEYSGTGPYGKTIAHGMMTLAFIAQLLNEWSDGAFDETGEIDVAFLGPVFPGDIVDATGIVEGCVEREGKYATLARISCKVEGRDILAGKSYLPIEHQMESK